MRRAAKGVSEPNRAEHPAPPVKSYGGWSPTLCRLHHDPINLMDRRMRSRSDDGGFVRGGLLKKAFCYSPQGLGPASCYEERVM
jgi:hypothetical protein